MFRAFKEKVKAKGVEFESLSLQALRLGISVSCF